MKKIMFFSGTMCRGGAEKVISILSNHYAKKGWDVHIGLLAYPKVEYPLESSIVIHDLSSKFGPRRGFLKICKNVKEIVEKENPDVVISFMAVFCMTVGIALRNSKVYMIVSERDDPYAYSNKVIQKFVNYAFRKADAVVFQTEHAKSYYSKKIQDKSRVIVNPIKVQCFRAKTQRKCIVSIGRLEEQKNIPMLIRAFADVHCVYPEYTLEIYGKGIMEESLRKLVAELKLEKSVFFMGTHENVHELISDAEIFALSSNHEGLSNAMLEAMMMGFPVVVTDVAGARDAIEDGENGFIVPVGDKDKMSDRLKMLIADSELRERMGHDAAETAVKFSAQRVIGEWEKIIEKKELF